jgi:hypothetical protein
MDMKTKTLWLLVLVAAGLVLTAGAAGALPDIHDLEADVSGQINYQGRLTNPGGVPLDGTFPMRFQIYDDPSAGTVQWDSGTVSIAVDNGLFNVVLSVDVNDFDGRGLWLRIYVNGEWLTPRQALLPVPYALSLRPGAEIQGAPTETGHVLRVEMTGTNATRAAVWGYTSTGDAVRGTSAGGYGLAGYTDDGYAVRGVDAGSSTARGYGGYFTSANGVGVYGYSNAAPHQTNMYAPGVYGRSLNGTGVYGLSDSDDAGVTGQSSAGNGVYGRSQDGSGLRGYSSNATGVYGATGGATNTDYGVYGTGGNGTYGVVGYKTGASGGLGVYGENEGTGSGVYGHSVDGFGIYGATGLATNNYGIYTPDNLYSANYHTLGAAMQIVQSSDTEPLEAGDVVEIAGMGASPAEGLPPVIQVRKVREAGSSAVLGVVASGYAREWLVDASSDDPGAASGANREISLSDAGPIAPGGYLLVVVRGPVQVKVDGSSAIRPGDLLSSAAQAGYAQKAPLASVEGSPAAQPGNFLGKALEAWDGGQGRIYVFVTLQ